MANLSPNETRSYHLEIKEDLHWKLVQMGAEFKLDHESFVEFAIENALLFTPEEENQPEVEAKPDDPLYKRIQSELDLYGSIWPPKLAQMFELIADIAEYRGSIDYDRDPGETADWLRNEAKKVREMEEQIIT